MRIPIPFCYEATVRTGTGNRVDRRYREVVEVEIPEFRAGDLPAVLTWRGSRPTQRDPGGAVTAVAHGGALFEPVLAHAWTGDEYRPSPVMAASVAAAVEMASAKIAGEAPSIHAVFHQDSVRKAFRDTDPFNHKGPPKPGTELRSDRDEALARARSLAADFVVVDGALLARVPEPLLHAHEKGVWIIPDLPQDDTPRRNLFRLDEMAAARERAMAAGAEAVDPPEFTLHRPDLLTRDLAGLTLRASAHALAGESGRRLAGMPLAVMELHCDLTEALHPPRPPGHYGSAPEPDEAALARAGLALCEALHGDGTRIVRECRQAFERALERLDVPSGPRP